MRKILLQAYQRQEAVTDELDGLGHCPQDEAPEVVNPILQQWFKTSS